MATTISLLNMKGGVGKTTLAVNVAWRLYSYSRSRVLLVDLDPQFNASQYIMSPEAWDKHRRDPGTVADLLLSPGKPEMRLKKKRKSQKALITKYLYEIESRPLRYGPRAGTDLYFHLLPSELVLAKAIKSPEGVAYKLEKALQPVQDNYDYVIIDCAPTDSVLTDTALMASDYVLIPMRPDRFSVLGYALMQESLESFDDTYPNPHKTRDLGVVFTQVSGESHIEEQCMAEIEDQASYVFDAYIPRSVRSYSKSVQLRKPIYRTPYARTATKNALRDVVVEMKSRLAELADENGE